MLCGEKQLIDLRCNNCSMSGYCDKHSTSLVNKDSINSFINFAKKLLKEFTLSSFLNNFYK